MLGPFDFEEFRPNGGSSGALATVSAAFFWSAVAEGCGEASPRAALDGGMLPDRAAVPQLDVPSTELSSVPEHYFNSGTRFCSEK